MEKYTTMTMTYETITPGYARQLLKTVRNNRNISKSRVSTYVGDIMRGKWNSMTGTSISINWDGELDDGQHRLSAIVKCGIPVDMWVCRGTEPKSLYDAGRGRSQRDQLQITCPNMDAIYRSNKVHGMINSLITGWRDRRTITSSEYAEYVDTHKEELDKFLSKINMNRNAQKITIQPVYVGMYLAYQNGIDIDVIADFYEILITGMQKDEKGNPVIAYRNYLLAQDHTSMMSRESLARCQKALYKYMTGSCAKSFKADGIVYWDYVE